MRKAERQAQRLLQDAAVEQPGIRPGARPELVVEALGYRVKRVDYLPRHRHGTNDPLNSVIIIAKNAYEPKCQSGVAHELFHLRAPLDVPPELLESYCDRGGAALAMPVDAFLKSGTACDWELTPLQAWWPHCSPLAILRRVTDLMAGTAVSAWTRARMHSRITSVAFELPAHSAELEEFVAAEALEDGRSELVLGGVRIRGWRNGEGRAVTLAFRVG